MELAEERRGERILYFAPRECWPPNTGARIRNYHLAEGLAQTCQLTYAFLEGPGEDAGPPLNNEGGKLERRFEIRCFRRDKTYSPGKIVQGLAGPVPLTVLNYSSAAAAAELEKLLRERQFDSVQLEGLHLMEYVPVIRRVLPEAAIVADWHDIQTVFLNRYLATIPARFPLGVLKRAYTRRTLALTHQAELRFLEACDAHSVVSGTDAENLRQRNAGVAVEVTPNGVDVGYFASAGRAEGELGDIVFVGAMEYGANADAAIWFAHQVWPLLSSGSGWKGKYRIVGRDPGPAVRALASGSIEVTGTVPDVRPYYRNALALVVPLRLGGGTRLKILEAMAAGVPVVSTRLGAEGIPVRDGEDILFAETAEEMESALRRLAADRDLRERLEVGGRNLVQRDFDWAALARHLRGIHDRAMERRRSRAR